MLEQYYTVNRAAGVSIHLLADHVSIQACGITVSHNQLSIDKKLTGLTNLEDLAKHFPPKTLIALNLTGKGILQKQAGKIEEIGQSDFSKLLPNASIDDFYVQNFISGDQSFVSAIRKPDADKWLNYLDKLGFAPLMLSLGPFPVQNIVGQLDVYGTEVIFDHHVIRRDEQASWTSYEYKESAASRFPVKLESESLDETLLLPYAAAFQLAMTDKIDAVQAPVPALQQALRNEVENKKVKVYGFALLAVFFALLLANFFVFSWLNASNAALTSQVSTFTQSTDDVHKISDLAQQKEGLLKTLGWEENVNKSWMIDQVASLLPGDITWREAAVDPVDVSATRLQKTIVFFNRRIRITGDAGKILPVNEWIARIKTMSWVKNVQLHSYTFNPELNTGQFMILIDY
ncbi:MAG: hypothetical protein ACHQHN_11795 [Sphingobacteriales bacterium]